MAILSLDSFSQRPLHPVPLAEDTSCGLRVVETNPLADPLWDAFVLAHPDATVYHHSGWLCALQEEYRQPAVHLACETPSGTRVGILPLIRTRGIPFNVGRQVTGRRLSSLPRTPLGGPLSLHSEATKLLLRAAVELTHQGPGIQLQLKTLSADLDGLVDGLRRTPWRASYVLQLPQDPEKLRFRDAAARKRIRWALGRAARLGVEVRPAGAVAELEAWYRIYLHAMRRNAVPPRSYRFFRAMWRQLHPKGLMRLLLAERQSAGQRTLLAGAIFLQLGSTVTYSFSGCRKEHFGYQPNDAILFAAIQGACRDGFRSFDLGEVAEGHEELVRFKVKWGAEPVPLHRYYYPPVSFVSPRSSGTVLNPGRAFEAVWRLLPLPATAVLGDWAYSRL